MITWDTSELTRLAVSFAASERAVGPAISDVVKRGAQNIKTDWARRATGIGHAPAYPDAITYDYLSWGLGARAEIGPDKDRRQGSLGNILEYGTSNNAPRPDGAAAFEAEAPKFSDAIGVAAGRLL